MCLLCFDTVITALTYYRSHSNCQKGSPNAVVQCQQLISTTSSPERPSHPSFSCNSHHIPGPSLPFPRSFPCFFLCYYLLTFPHSLKDRRRTTQTLLEWTKCPTRDERTVLFFYLVNSELCINDVASRLLPESLRKRSNAKVFKNLF